MSDTVLAQNDASAFHTWVRQPRQKEGSTVGSNRRRCRVRTGQSQGAQRVTQTGSRVGAAPQSAQMHAIGSYFAQLGHRHEVAKTGTAKGPPTPHSSATAHGSDAVRHQLSRSGVDADQRRTKQPPFLTLGCPPAVGWAPCLCLPPSPSSLALLVGSNTASS